MIKLATMSSVCPDWTLDQVVEGMQRHGYQGFEPRVEWGHASGIEATLTARERERIRARMEGEGLEICCIASGARMAAADPAERAGHVEEVKKYIDLAADLGCSRVRVFGGERDRRRELMAVVDYVVEGFAQVLPAAESRGVTLLLETHDEWCASAPVRAVVEQTGSPHLRVLWDFMHPQRELEKVEESFQVLRRVHQPHPRSRRPHRRRTGGGQRCPGERDIRLPDPPAPARRSRIQRLLLGRGDPRAGAAATTPTRCLPARRRIAAVAGFLIGPRLRRLVKCTNWVLVE